MASRDTGSDKKVLDLIGIRANSGEVLAVNLDEMQEKLELVFGGISLLFEQDSYQEWCEQILSALRTSKLGSKK